MAHGTKEGYDPKLKGTVHIVAAFPSVSCLALMEY